MIRGAGWTLLVLGSLPLAFEAQALIAFISAELSELSTFLRDMDIPCIPCFRLLAWSYRDYVRAVGRTFP
jgi:hypothetical protein